MQFFSWFDACDAEWRLECGEARGDDCTWAGVAEDVAPARAEGSSTAACLDETEFLFLPFSFFEFPYELAVHDAVDIGFA